MSHLLFPPSVHLERWDRPRIVNVLRYLKKNYQDISPTGLKALDSGGMLVAAKTLFGSYAKAVHAAGFDYVQECRPPSPRTQRQEAGCQQLLKKIGKTPEQLTAGDLEKAGLSCLLPAYGNSPYRVVKELGLLRRRPPKGYWDDKRNRIKAVRKVLRLAKKHPAQLTYQDFQNHGYERVFSRQSLYTLLQEAGILIHPWQLVQVPGRWWKKKKRRIRAIRWLIKQIGKPPARIQKADFERQRLGGLLAGRYGNDVRRALREAGYPSYL